MARLIYACRFEITIESGLNEVVDSYCNWLMHHYRERRGIDGFFFDPNDTNKAENLPDNHNLSSTVYETEIGKVIRILWSFPDNRDSGLHWSNEVRMGQFGDRCSVEHLISIESVIYNLAPARLRFGSPRVIREICSTRSTYIGDMHVRATPYVLCEENLSDFLNLLTSDLRQIPLVLLAPYARGESNAIDTSQLAQNLAGVAIVVQIIDPEITWDFADEVGSLLSCYDGAARIYWPGFSKDSLPHDHRLFLGTWIKQVGDSAARRSIGRTVFSVAVFRFVSDHRIDSVMRAAEAAARQKQLDERKAAGDNFWEDYERDLARLDEAEREIRDLRIENANLKANQKILISDAFIPNEPEEISKEEKIMVSSVAEAVQEARNRMHNIEFLPTALSSAKKSPFQRPNDIYEALMSLDGIVEDWRKRRENEGSGGDILQHLQSRGLGKRSSMHISNTTRGKYRTHYEFDYQNERRLFEPHITIGSGDHNSCASIHFIFDQEREKMVIAHVGKHLPNTRT